ncbi:MAG TPA: acyltransferase [Bacteroidales bacterium]|nr:acyltransferase [Bacteroidales bacterium]
MNIENIVKDWLERNSESLSGRVMRFLAMYFPDARVRRKFWIKTGVLLGENTYLNQNVTVTDNYMNGETLLEIGANCSIAPGVVFAPYSAHNNSKIMRESGLLSDYEKKEKIVIGDDVWIGANCTILPGVRIGKCCIIGANSLVNKNIPDYSLAFGNPVRIIKDLRK